MRRCSAAARPRAGCIVPPLEYDPDTGDEVSELVPVGQAGVVTTWAWVPEPMRKHPLDRPFAWALVQLDGADTSLLHALDVPSPDDVHTGMRVRIRWSDERVGPPPRHRLLRAGAVGMSDATIEPPRRAAPSASCSSTSRSTT